jgi:hypothetical protein
MGQLAEAQEKLGEASAALVLVSPISKGKIALIARTMDLMHLICRGSKVIFWQGVNWQTKQTKSSKQLVKGYMGWIQCSQPPMLCYLRGSCSIAVTPRLIYSPKKETLERASLSLSTIRNSKEPLLPSTLSQILRQQGMSSVWNADRDVLMSSLAFPRIGLYQGE